jgi:hypothetical protein
VADILRFPVEANVPALEADVCPNCGFPVAHSRVRSRARRAVARVVLTKEEKKHAQDVAKCEAAIACLERRISMPEESLACKVAFGEEIIRLSTALQFQHSDPYKLKRIFRRKET